MLNVSFSVGSSVLRVIVVLFEGERDERVRADQGNRIPSRADGFRLRRHWRPIPDTG